MKYIPITIELLQKRILFLQRRYLRSVGWKKVGRKYAQLNPFTPYWTINEAYYFQLNKEKQEVPK